MIEEIRTFDAEIADGLASLARDFEYGRMWQLVEDGKGTPDRNQADFLLNRARNQPAIDLR